MHYNYVFICVFNGEMKTWKYLEVSHHDESGSTDPACGKTCRVEDAVLVLLDDVGITEQHDHHHCSQIKHTHGGGGAMGQFWLVHLQVFSWKIQGRWRGTFFFFCWKRKKEVHISSAVSSTPLK